MATFSPSLKRISHIIFILDTHETNYFTCDLLSAGYRQTLEKTLKKVRKEDELVEDLHFRLPSKVFGFSFC